MRRARGGNLARLFGVLCALALLTGRCTAGEEAPPAAQRSLQCERELRCSTGGAGFGDQLEHYVFCELVSFLLNATLVLSPDSFARGSKRHCCVDEYPAVAKLLGVVGEALPTTQGGAPPPPEPRNTRQVSFAEARDLHAAWQNGTAALPCDVAFVTTINSCPDTPANNWCSFLPSYDAFSVVRPRLQARGARAPQLCAERHLAMHTPGEVDVPVVVMHVRTGDVCIHCEDSGIYFRRVLERLLAASPTLTRGHRLVLLSQFPLPFLADGLFVNATFAVNQTLASSACTFLTADVVIASGSSLPAFIVAFAPSWAPIILEERRKEAQPRIAPRRADLFPPIPPHYFSSEDAILLDDGIPSLDNATLATRIENALEQLRRSRNASNNSVPAAPGNTAPSLIMPPPMHPSPQHLPLPVNVTLTTLPWNTTHPMINNTHVLIGWRRKSATELMGQTVSATRSNLTEPWNDRPNCIQLSNFEYAGHNPDVLHVSVCDGPAPLPSSTSEAVLAAPALDYVVCVPPLHGLLNAAWLAEWLAWHAALGAQAFFIYVVDVGVGPGDVPRLSTPPGTTLHWFNVSWLTAFDSHSVGHHWAMHDCLYRNRAAGAAWGLFMDIDELLIFPPLRDGLRGLVRFLGSRNSTAATFGSVPYLQEMCMLPDAGPCTSLTQRTVYRAQRAEGCVNGPGHADWPDAAWRWCPNWHGRRKFIAFLPKTTRVDVHGVWPDDHGSDAGVVLDAERAWIKHVRGAPFSPNVCVCSRKLGSPCSALPGCVDLPDGGLDCSSTGTFHDDAPFIAAATAFGALEGWTSPPYAA